MKLSKENLIKLVKEELKKYNTSSKIKEGITPEQEQIMQKAEDEFENLFEGNIQENVEQINVLQKKLNVLAQVKKLFNEGDPFAGAVLYISNNKFLAPADKKIISDVIKIFG